MSKEMEPETRVIDAPHGLARSKLDSMAVGRQHTSLFAELAQRVDLLFYVLISALCILQVALCRRVESYVGDSSYYIGFAHSLARAGSFVFNFRSDTRFPPGLPLILGGIETIFGGGFSVFVRSMPLFGVLGLLGYYHVLRREENRAVAAAGCLLLAFSPYFFGMATQDVFSDLPYMAASALALLLAIHAERAKTVRMRWAGGAGFAVALSAALMIRSAGISLLIGLAAWLFSSFVFPCPREVARRRLRVFLPALVLGIAAQASWAAWQSKVRVPDLPGDFTNSAVRALLLKDPHRPELGRARLADVPARAEAGLRNHGAHVSEVLIGVEWVAPLWYSPLVLAPILLVGLGLFGSLLRNGGHYLEWYLVAYILMFLLWPFDQGARFMAAVFPALFLYLLRGGRWLAIWAWLSLPWSLDCLCVGSVILFVGSSFSVRYSATLPGLQGGLAVIAWAGLAVASLLLRWTHPKWRGWFSLAGAQGVQIGLGSKVGFKLNGRFISLALVTALALCGLGHQIEIGRANLSAAASHFEHDRWADAGMWLASHAAPEDVVMGREPAILHRLTDRRIVSLPLTSDTRLIMDVIHECAVRFLVVVDPMKYESSRPIDSERFRALSERYPQVFQLVHCGPGNRIFRITPVSAHQHEGRATPRTAPPLSARDVTAVQKPQLR